MVCGQSEEDAHYEQDIFRDPYGMKPWLRYIEYKTKNGTIQEQVFVRFPLPFSPPSPPVSDSDRSTSAHAKNSPAATSSGKATSTSASRTSPVSTPPNTPPSTAKSTTASSDP